MNVYALRTDEVAILDVLRGIAHTYKKKYCFPSQQTVLAKLREFHGIVFSLATLNRRFSRLEKLGYIRRIRRLSREAFKSTVYYVCDRVGVASGKIKKILGYSKRLASLYPSRLSKLTNNMINTKSSFVSDGLKEPPAALSKTCGSGPYEKTPEGSKVRLGLLKFLGVKGGGVREQ